MVQRIDVLIDVHCYNQYQNQQKSNLKDTTNFVNFIEETKVTNRTFLCFNGRHISSAFANLLEIKVSSTYFHKRAFSTTRSLLIIIIKTTKALIWFPGGCLRGLIPNHFFRLRLLLRRLRSAYELAKTRLTESKAEAEG